MIKLIMQCLLMGVGIGLALIAIPDNGGAMMALGGLLTGIGAHWYHKGLGFKSVVVGLLMTCTVPLIVGAVVMSQPLLGLIGFVFGGIAARMTFIKKEKAL